MPGTALSHLRVLDLSQYVAGPYCTKLLADFGAEVIKVEKPGHGDGGRRIGPFLGDDPHPEKSGLFLYLNTSKKSITLNLKSRAGVSIFRELAKAADVVVESFRPGTMARLGLDYESLERINPQLILTSVSNFGQTGPYRDYEATEIVGWATSGQMYIMGDPGREPLKAGGYQTQYLAAAHTAIGTLGAIYARESLGIGQHVDASLMESGATVHQLALMWYTILGAIEGRIGSRLPIGHPYTLLPCRNGYVAVTAIPPGIPGLALLMEKPELEEDPRFLTPNDQLEHADELDAILVEWLKDKDKEEVVARAQELRMPFDFVQTTEELLRDPQLLDRGFFVDIDHPVCGALTYPGAPFKMDESPWRAGRAPLLGEHNEEVYCGLLGYEPEELARLRAQDVI